MRVRQRAFLPAFATDQIVRNSQVPCLPDYPHPTSNPGQDNFDFYSYALEVSDHSTHPDKTGHADLRRSHKHSSDLYMNLTSK
jgi:hypothetical protein